MKEISRFRLDFIVEPEVEQAHPSHSRWGFTYTYVCKFRCRIPCRVARFGGWYYVRGANIFFTVTLGSERVRNLEHQE